MIRSLQIAVLQILDATVAQLAVGKLSYDRVYGDWSVQGFGMLRLYVRGVGRLHVWDSALRYPGVSMIHNHSWDLKSTVVSGHLVNTRFTEGTDHDGIYSGHRMITGYHCSHVTDLPEGPLKAEIPERYWPGQTYTQHAAEIHRTDADDSTISIMERQEDVAGQADIYWPAGTAWGTAKPRRATPGEVLVVLARAIKVLEHELGIV